MEPLVPNTTKTSTPLQKSGTDTISKNNLLVRPIRTMKNDMEEAMRRQNETAVSIALAEEKKKEKARAEALLAKQKQAEGAPQTYEVKKIGRFIIVLVFVLIIALLALTYLFVLPKLGAIQIPKISLPVFEKAAEIITPPAVELAEPLAQSIIPAQSEKRLNISTETRTGIIAAIASEKGKGVPSGTVKNLYFVEPGMATSTNQTSASQLLSFIEAQVPSILMRSLEPEFMFGFFGESNGGATPFIALNVFDHNSGLAGMLEWEGYLPAFFNTFFSVKTSDVKQTFQKFNSIVILGKDARVIEMSPTVKIFYMFANENLIIIAGSQSAVEELVLLVGKN